MRLKQKALAFLTVLLLAASNGFGAVPAAAAGSYSNPSYEFGRTDYRPYVHDKGYLGTKYSPSGHSTSCDFTLSAGTPVWEQDGDEYDFDDMIGPALQYVSVRNEDNNYFLYEKQGGGFTQVVPSSTARYIVTESSSGGFPRIQVSLNDATRCDNDIENVALFFSGTAAPGRITIKKAFEATGDAARDFGFTVTGPGMGGEVRNVSVAAGNADGVTVKVPYGTYYIRELAGDGYKFISFAVTPNDSGTGMVSADTLKVVVGDGGFCSHKKSYTVTCTNRQLGSIDITKAVDGAAPGDGAQFGFAVTGPNGYSESLTLADGGSRTLGNLEYGTYTIAETSIPAGYRWLGFSGGAGVPGESAVQFTVDSEHLGFSVTCNNQKLGNLHVMKYDTVTQRPVGGVVFHITGPDYDEMLTTDASSGSVVLMNLTPGDVYTVTEISAPDGYRINDPDPRTQTIEAGTTTAISFADDPIGWIKVAKADADDHDVLLDGAVFEVADNAGFAGAVTLPATSSGHATSPALKAGHWWVREITPPAGYVKDDSVKEVDVAMGQTAGVTFYDPADEGSLRVVKTSALTGGPVQGVTFELMDNDPEDPSFGPGNILVSAQTGADGSVVFDHLRTGRTFWVRETASVPGYGFDPAVVKSAVIAYDQTVEISFENSPVASVGVVKTDKADAGIKLAGAVYCVYCDAECATLVQTLPATDENGEAVGDPLPFGPGCPEKYYVKELSAPDGYLVSAEVFEAVFTEPGQTLSVAVSDVRNEGSIVILKVDALNTSKTLAGAEFKLYSDEALTAQVGSAVTTGADGIARFDNLTPGSYWLKETKAPEDYDLLTDPLPVTVTAGVTQPEAIVLTNQYNPPDDIQTGTADYTMVLAGGGTAIAGGLALLAAWLLKRKLKAK